MGFMNKLHNLREDEAQHLLHCYFKKVVNLCEQLQLKQLQCSDLEVWYIYHVYLRIFPTSALIYRNISLKNTLNKCNDLQVHIVTKI